MLTRKSLLERETLTACHVPLRELLKKCKASIIKMIHPKTGKSYKGLELQPITHLNELLNPSSLSKIAQECKMK